MKAGIDCGTSLTKFAWLDQGSLQLFSTANGRAAESILDEMCAVGVTRARITGIGARPMADPIVLEECAGDPIADEIALQAAGTRRLLAEKAPDEFLLVSIGTGTSYTFVTKDGAERFPLGNALGGGFIAGVARLLGVRNPEDIGRQEDFGRTLDILVRDAIPATAGTPQGEFVVAHFGKAAFGDVLPLACASLLQTVAVAVVRDLMLFGMLRPMPADVVFIGSTVVRLAPLRKQLAAYVPFTGMIAHFPEKGEYAAALGALYAP